MSTRLKMVVLMTMVLVIVSGLPALAQARGAGSVTKPKLSATPVMGEAFTVTGLVRPKATTTSRTVVRIRLYMLRMAGGPRRAPIGEAHPHSGRARHHLLSRAHDPLGR